MKLNCSWFDSAAFTIQAEERTLVGPGKRKHGAVFLAKIRLGVTGAEVLNFIVYLPGERCIGAFRVHPFAVQGNSIPRLDVRRVAGKRVYPFIFFVGQTHPVRSRDDAARNRSFFSRFVNDNDDYDYQGDRHSHDSYHDIACVITQLICLSGDGKDHAESDNQGSTPEKFLRHIVLLDAKRNPRL